MNNQISNNFVIKPIQIFDTTLRDGDQGAKTGFTPEEKYVTAKKLREIGVNVIEAGFAISGNEVKTIQKIVEYVGTDKYAPTICSLAGATEKHIDAAEKALYGAKNPRIHTFIATSDIHINKKFKKSGATLEARKEWVLKQIEKSVTYAKKTGYEVQWSAECATDTNPDFLLKVCIIAIKSGATIINLPDTLGRAGYMEIERMFNFISKGTKHLKEQGYKFIFSSHCHNDLGYAVPNTLAAIRSGVVEQVEVTVMGIGERTGNASLHGVIGNICERATNIIEGTKIITSVKSRQIYPISSMVSQIIGRQIPENEPFIGKIATLHGAGIHNAATKEYSAINAKDYGTVVRTKTFGPRGGTAEVVAILNRYGIKANKKDSVIQKVADIGKGEAQYAREVYDSRIYAIYLEEKGDGKINSININGNNVRISLSISGKEVIILGKGDKDNGIIAATINGINEFLDEEFISVVKYDSGSRASIQKIAGDFNVHISGVTDSDIERGEEQIGIVEFILQCGKKKIKTKHASRNIDNATVRAILDGAIERIIKKVQAL